MDHRKMNVPVICQSVTKAVSRLLTEGALEVRIPVGDGNAAHEVVAYRAFGEGRPSIRVDIKGLEIQEEKVMSNEDIERIKNDIEQTTRPSRMDKREAMELHEVIASHCEGWADTLREEIEREERDAD